MKASDIDLSTYSPEELNRLWKSIPIEDRGLAFCEVNPRLYTEATVQVSARAKRLAKQDWSCVPVTVQDAAAFHMRYAAYRDIQDKQRIKPAPIEDRPPRHVQPMERFGIDPKAKQNTVLGIGFELVRKHNCRGKFWAIRNSASGAEYRTHYPTKAKIWDYLAWFASANPENFIASFSQ